MAQEQPMSPNAPAVRHVRVDALAWVTRFVGGNGTQRITFTEEAAPGDSLRDVLHRLSARFPKLAEALWDPRSGDLGEHIEVMVNSAILGVERELDSECRDGDSITLMGQFMGG